MQTWLRPLLIIGAVLMLTARSSPGAATNSSAVQRTTDVWRAQRRLIDMHLHINGTTQHVARATKILESVGIGLGVNLSGGTVTRTNPQAPSEFERNKALTDALAPGRFLHYMNLDYKGWDSPDFSERAVKQIEEGHRLGAAGLKEFKRLGLYLRDGAGNLLKIDDSKLDPVWQRCGELGMPVSIHVGDPKAFWLPFDPSNERWKELKDHRNWWFGDTNLYPPRMDLVNALSRVIARHPKTTFVCVHFANNPEDIEWVDKELSRLPNMHADLAARIPEIGRHHPNKLRQLFVKHQDRIVFATDFQVYDHLTLGSGGSGPPPTDADAEAFYAKCWRFLETNDKHWEHMTPIQGDWTISSIDLPVSVLRKVYFDNARRILARSLPLAPLRVARVEREVTLDGRLDEPEWQRAQPIWIERETATGAIQPEIATTLRALWTDRYLFLSYECPYTRLNVFEPPQKDSERQGLWDRDVVEAFIGSNLSNITHYKEFEVAPTNERLDLAVRRPETDFSWSSGFQSEVRIDKKARRWTAEWRIPLQALSATSPSPGTTWRGNFFRCDKVHKAFLTWNPTLQGSFHIPERFGVIVFDP